MATLQASMIEYKNQLQNGNIVRAYRGLMAYMQDLRTHFAKTYPDYFVSGSLYTGFMDMTYFAVSPPALKQRSLKAAIVFVHEAFRFEVWLSGANRQIQAERWKVIKTSGWDTYSVVPVITGSDAIVEHVLVAEPNFDDLPALTDRIERGTLRFIHEVEAYLTSR